MYKSSATKISYLPLTGYLSPSPKTKLTLTVSSKSRIFLTQGLATIPIKCCRAFYSVADRAVL